MLADKPTGKTFDPAPEGAHAAVCTQIVDLGKQETSYGMKDQLRISWEIAEMMENGQPFAVSQFYTLSLNEKAKLRKDLESWRGRKFSKEELAGFDLEKLLGKPCLLNIVHNQVERMGEDRVYANIASISPMPKGMTPPEPVGPLLCYSRDDRRRDVLEALPEWLGDKVTTGMGRLDAEARATAAPSAGKPAAADRAADDLDDDIPF